MSGDSAVRRTFTPDAGLPSRKRTSTDLVWPHSDWVGRPDCCARAPCANNNPYRHSAGRKVTTMLAGLLVALLIALATRILPVLLFSRTIPAPPRPRCCRLAN